ncbi:MAG: hypothetical protein ACWA40_09185 [Planktomarina sp.]
MAQSKKSHDVYTLLITVGRKEDDGIPGDAKGAILVVYSSGVDEAESVREAIAVLKQAGLAPLDVTGYGTKEERIQQGHDIEEEEAALMQRALDENAVVVAQMTPFYEDLKNDD